MLYPIHCAQCSVLFPFYVFSTHGAIFRNINSAQNKSNLCMNRGPPQSKCESGRNKEQFLRARTTGSGLIPWEARPVSAHALCNIRPGHGAAIVPAACQLWCGCPPVSQSVCTMTPTTHSFLLSVSHCRPAALSAGPAGLPTLGVLPAAPHLCFNTNAHSACHSHKITESQSTVPHISA